MSKDNYVKVFNYQGKDKFYIKYSSPGVAWNSSLLNNDIKFDDKPSIRKLSDLLIWQNQKKEYEADTWGVYYALSAGFNLDKAADYWRRLSIFQPHNINNKSFSVHPGNAVRALAMDKEIVRLKKILSID